MSPDSATEARLVERVRALEHLFEHIRRERMQGVPLLHPALRVQALGFQLAPQAGWHDDEATPAAHGVLITPWCMNLLSFPLQRVTHPRRGSAKFVQNLGARGFEFLPGHDAHFGAFASCTLFSPMQDFSTQDEALGTAREVLRQLRDAVAAAPEAAPTPSTSPRPHTSTRRGLLFGRGAPGTP